MVPTPSSLNSNLALPKVFSDKDNLWNFLGLILCLMATLPITFLIWKKCFFEKFGAFMPLDKDLTMQENNKKRLFMKTSTWNVLTQLFVPLMDTLNSSYWSTHVGVDGYMYLLFQRKFKALI